MLLLPKAVNPGISSSPQRLLLSLLSHMHLQVLHVFFFFFLAAGSCRSEWQLPVEAPDLRWQQNYCRIASLNAARFIASSFHHSCPIPKLVIRLRWWKQAEGKCRVYWWGLQPMITGQEGGGGGGGGCSEMVSHAVYFQCWWRNGFPLKYRYLLGCIKAVTESLQIHLMEPWESMILINSLTWWSVGQKLLWTLISVCCLILKWCCER